MAKVLLVDDDLVYVELLREHFEGLGHELVALDKSSEAFNIIQSYEPDIVILDIEMPVNGKNILLVLKEIRPEIPVVMYSAYPKYKDDPDIEKADAFVTKSPDLGELVKTVASLAPILS